METKKKGIAVVTEAVAQAALRRGATHALSAEEERVVRMRLGAVPPRTAPLARAVEARSDLEIELLSYEIEAYMKWRARQATAGARAPAPQPSRAKEKIIRALRRKA